VRLSESIPPLPPFAAPAPTEQPQKLLQQSGIRFTENRGQVVDTEGKVRGDIAFVADAPGARLYFRDDE
jgi:hypothetical protein